MLHFTFMPNVSVPKQKVKGNVFTPKSYIHLDIWQLHEKKEFHLNIKIYSTLACFFINIETFESLNVC